MARLKLEKPRGILNVRANEPMTGMWRYWPSDDLAPFVEHYWTIEWDMPNPEVRETLPHPSVHLILERGRPEELAGVTTSKFTRVIEGKSRVFSVKLWPGGFRPFIDAPVSTLSDRVCNLADVLGASAKGLCCRALAHADHQATIGVIEKFLRAFNPRADEAMRVVQDIANRVINDRSITRVEQIVRRIRHRQTYAATIVRRLRRRQSEMGDPAFSSARSRRTHRVVAGCALERNRAGTRLRRPGAFHPRFQETDRQITCGLFANAVSGSRPTLTCALGDPPCREYSG